MSTFLIAITGGIGSGKSVVSRVLRAMGYPVYDCDSQAKAIMDADAEIHRRLCSEIDAAVVTDGVIDRKRLAEIVFNDKAKLAVLNAIVHSAVKAHLA
ncbi:MAG: dephospho-CoA kinase, partial [Muribaculaceae bacterium]|nr:dephospho-CoA kinase [Muribaculaceae bacterium]